MSRRTLKRGGTLTPNERLRASIGLSPSASLRAGLPVNGWERWDKGYGPWFRQRHGLAPARDDIERIEREPAPAGDWPLPPGTQD